MSQAPVPDGGVISPEMARDFNRSNGSSTPMAGRSGLAGTGESRMADGAMIPSARFPIQWSVKTSEPPSRRDGTERRGEREPHARSSHPSYGAGIVVDDVSKPGYRSRRTLAESGSGSGWCISRAHWPAALSSEQSCGSPYKGTRARGSRCRRLVCAAVRTCGESAHSRPHLPATNVPRTDKG